MRYQGLSSANGGPQVVNVASAAALVVGPNGAISPTFVVDTSTAGSVTGIKISGGPAAGGAFIDVVSSGTNERLVLRSKGSGLNARVTIPNQGLDLFLGFRIFDTAGLVAGAMSGKQKFGISGSVLSLASDIGIQFVDADNIVGATVDLGLRRSASGVLEIDNGNLGSFRDLKVRNLFTTLPTSAAGLATGQLWNNAGVVNVA